MEFLDARRLTGINVVWDQQGVIADIGLAEDDDAERLKAVLTRYLEALLPALGWADERVEFRRFAGGLSVIHSAPIDALYAASDALEWVANAAVAEIEGHGSADIKEAVQRFGEAIAAEANSELIRLREKADAVGVSFRADDETATLGSGPGSRTWAVDAIDSAAEVSDLFDVPIALVTGTNGKTTTVRLCARILKVAGKRVGLSSTDWISVDGEILDRGDYSGPGGARAVLADQRVDVAILETARGGLLRRGLGVERADVALITNIAEDHLGDYGSQNLSELTRLKWIIMRALDQDSCAVLNADDALLVENSRTLSCPIRWFSLDPSNPVLTSATAQAPACSVSNGALAEFDGSDWTEICPLTDIPITLGGIARHNVANALAATALCSALGISRSTIAEGLRSMTSNDNPGRCNMFDLQGRQVLVDFAHNPEGMAAIFSIARNLPAKRRVLCFAQAGDRTDRQIRELAQGAAAIGLDRVIVSELADYARGREAGEVYALLRDELISQGQAADSITHNELEMESLDEALAWAEPGDLIIMLALAESRKILARLEELASA